MVGVVAGARTSGAAAGACGAAEERDAWRARGGRGAGGCKQRANYAPVFSPASVETTYVMAAGAVTPSKLIATAQEHKEERTCEQDQQPEPRAPEEERPVPEGVGRAPP